MEIPLYDASERFVRHVSTEFIADNEHAFRIIRNRRGHIRRAYVRENESLDMRPFSKLGMGFEQSLSTGRVWALRGTTGASA